MSEATPEEALRREWNRAETRISMLEEELATAREWERKARHAYQAAATYECAVCSRGIWDANLPHSHWSHKRPSGKDVYYSAKVVQRPLKISEATK